MNIRNIAHFSDGLVLNTSRGKAPLTSLLEAKNVRIHQGDSRLRSGTSYLDDSIFIDGDIDALYEYAREYWDVNDDITEFHREYLFTSGENIYAWQGPGDSDIWHINEDTPLNSSDIWVAVIHDKAYICNGVDPLYRYDAVKFWSIGIDAPTLSDSDISRTGSTQTDMRGFRKYKYRYVRKVTYGATGDVDYLASPFSEVVASPDFFFGAMNISLQPSDDEKVTGIELYTTELVDYPYQLEGKPFYLLGYFDNIVQTQTDNVANVTLLREEAAIDGEHSHTLAPDEDWGAPPDGMKYIVFFKDRLYAVDVVNNPSVVRYTPLGFPDSWPDDYYVGIRQDDGDVITGMAVRGNTMYFFKNRSIWTMTGDPEAQPLIQPVSSGDITASQTEFGIGCTAPRSIASYGDDYIIFYSKVHGVYAMVGNKLVDLSKNIGSDIRGLSDECAGAVLVDSDGDPFYVLSPPTGNTWICHIPSRSWVQDTNINVSCFLVDHNGYLLGGKGGYIARFYDPDADTDNGDVVKGTMKTGWLNLRNGIDHALVRGLTVQKSDILNNITVELENERGQMTSYVIESDRVDAAFDDLAGRLFSSTFTWTEGSIESVSYHFRRRRERYGRTTAG